MNKLKINIAKNYKWYMLVSAIIILAGIAAMFINGFNWGIDFSGGSIAQFELNQEFETSDIKAVMDKFDKDAVISSASSGTQVIIKSSIDFSDDTKYEIFDAFKAKYNLTQDDMLSFDTVSATIGKDLQKQALLASAITVVCILIYITLRFEFLSGIASIIALIHDILIVLSVYAVFGLTVNSSFIAAILTILGYSINSSIVVFDRVREEKKKHGKYEFAQLIDDSLSRSLKRTVYTTITTLLAVGALYACGVDSIKDFTLPMIVGFISGAYSSLFIAGGFWYYVKQTGYKKGQTKVKKA